MRFMQISLGVFLVLLLISGCSNSDSQNSEEYMDHGNESKTAESTSEDRAQTGESKKKESNNQSGDKGLSNSATSTDVDLTNKDEKMMIYTAEIFIKTKDYANYQEELKQLIQQHNGYIVNSSFHQGSNELSNGTIKLRVPKNEFTPFLDGLSPLSGKITSRNTQGEDVTEQYVDLESRLNAKQKFEERLLSFMDKAEKTEDLLKISKDLERVQEEIEVIKGKMKYLRNHSEYSTITLNIHENKVVVQEPEQEDLKTWEKVEKTFKGSLQSIQKFLSFLAIVFLGLSPIFIILIGFAAFLFFGSKKIKKKKKPDDTDYN